MRIEGWESRLTEHLESTEPFAWGTRDCITDSAAWIEKAIGTDFAKDIRGTYDSKETAAEVMASKGYPDVEAIADAHLTVIPITFARRGDLLLHPQGLLGICAGKDGVFLTDKKTTTIGTLACVKAWSVD